MEKVWILQNIKVVDADRIIDIRKKILNILSIVQRKSRIAFIEPLLTSSMILERHIDGCIRETTPYGLTQFKILLSILRANRTAKKSAKKSDGHDCSQAAIAEGWGVSEAAISRQINMLVKDKLITQTQDPHEMRRSVLGLTAKGKTFVSKTMRTVDKELGKIFRPVSKTGRNQLTANLNKVTELLLEHMPHCDILN